MRHGASMRYSLPHAFTGDKDASLVCRTKRIGSYCGCQEMGRDSFNPSLVSRKGKSMILMVRFTDAVSPEIMYEH